MGQDKTVPNVKDKLFLPQSPFTTDVCEFFFPRRNNGSHLYGMGETQQLTSEEEERETASIRLTYRDENGGRIPSLKKGRVLKDTQHPKNKQLQSFNKLLENRVRTVHMYNFLHV